MKTFTLVSSALLPALAAAQGAAYAQCGGNGWSGQSTCVSGYYCKYANDYYSQCVPGSAPGGGSAATTLATSTVKTSPSSTATTTPTKGKFKWLGVDESGAEFGEKSLPGVWGKDFTFPADSSLDTLMSQGFNVFRVPFLMERMVPNQMTGAVDAAYLANYTATVNHITSKGGYAVIDPHNYGRYYGNIITDTTAFGAFWKTVATAFKSNSKAIFDTNNEYHDMDQTLVLNLNQAAINAIRGAGATSQYIFAEGNSYTGAWTWTKVNDNMKALTDPQNKLVYEMHQYLDSDGSGTSDVCVSSDIGASRVSTATAWLKQNGKQGIIGEYAAGANAQCQSAIKGMLDHMQTNSDVWLGAIWWGGGPWWGNYIYGFEPPSSTAYNYYLSTLTAYKP